MTDRGEGEKARNTKKDRTRRFFSLSFPSTNLGTVRRPEGKGMLGKALSLFSLCVAWIDGWMAGWTTHVCGCCSPAAD